MEQMLAVAVLAAGKGTRMRSAHPKVLQPLAGATLFIQPKKAVNSSSKTASIVLRMLTRRRFLMGSQPS